MVRLLLLSSPALCLLSGIGISEILHFFVKQFKNYDECYDNENTENQTQTQSNTPSNTQQQTSTQRRGNNQNQNTTQTPTPTQTQNLNNQSNLNQKEKKVYRYSFELVIVIIFILVTMLISFILHCTWVGAEAYASPSIILANKDRYGNKHIIDDFREAYYWLRMNTKPDAKIISWWDYGYQIAGMSNRAVIVDNNTWNTTHIATVGATLASEEEESYKICKMLDADYILLIFGGFSAYSGDDINKFIWMIRITAGYYPKVKEDNFLARGVYRTDSGATETMLNSVMYKLSYYRFDEVKPSRSSPEGYDLVRGYTIGKKNIKLRHFSEAYTTNNWIVRIFSVNDWPNREIPIKSRFKIKNSRTTQREFNKIKPPRN